VIVLALATVLPSVWAELYNDDYPLLGILSGSMRDVYPSRLDIFNLFDGDPERMRRMVDLGLLPWWADPGVRHAFWRPVSALTHWVDYALWRDWPVPMHLHSLGWLGVLIGAAYATYRQFMGHTAAAGLAALLYALDRPHGFNAVEVSSRNTMLGALFGVLTVLLHDRWRRAGWRLGTVAAPGCFAVALLSVENAVAAGGYLVAHAVFLERGSWSGRFRALLPYGLVFGVWYLLYNGLGYGVTGHPDYINLVREPLRFASALVERAPVFLSAQWFGPPAESVVVLPQAALVRWVAAVISLAVLLLLLAALLKRDPVARFWGLGQALAVVPLCAGSGLHDRYLLIVGLGAMGLLAQFLWGLASQAPWCPQRPVALRAAMLMACGLVGIHAIVSPLQVLGSTISRAAMKPLADTLPADPAIRRQVLVVVNVPPGGAGLAYWFFARTVKNLPIPGQTRALTFGLPSIRIERIDASSLRVRWGGRHEVVRPPGRPLAVGQWTHLAGTDVEVTAMSHEGWPVEAIFRFDTTLEDPQFRWVEWDKSRGHFAAFQPPAIGESAIVR